jgi:hypothetical protein
MNIVRTILLVSGILLVVTGAVLALIGLQRHLPQLETVGAIILCAGFADLIVGRILIARMSDRDRPGPPPAG